MTVTNNLVPRAFPLVIWNGRERTKSPRGKPWERGCVTKNNIKRREIPIFQKSFQYLDYLCFCRKFFSETVVRYPIIQFLRRHFPAKNICHNFQNLEQTISENILFTKFQVNCLKSQNALCWFFSLTPTMLKLNWKIYSKNVKREKIKKTIYS